MAEKYLIRDADNEGEYELDRQDGVVRVRRAGSDEWKQVELQQIGESPLYLLMVDSKPMELFLQRRRGGALATIGRHQFDYDVERWRPRSAGPASRKEASGPRRITAPMTGSIVEVRCHPGQTVQPGDVLLVIESMKMNNELRSPAAGVVEQVPVTAGERVTAGQLLVAVNASPAPEA
ncbi:MAG: biotin/lipoyl-binding protein [Dehalococcoidia bacterium]|nr:biotin/lipoyl-binding protein [Dehalococcoidia bacterium]